MYKQYLHKLLLSNWETIFKFKYFTKSTADLEIELKFRW